MKKPIIKILDKLIVTILASLGIFTSCQAPEYGDPVCEYGTPEAEYEITGTVKNKENSHPIENIRIIHQNYYDTIYTDADGKYAFIYRGNLLNNIDLIVEDIDGEDNGGKFESKTVNIKITEDDKVKNGSGWYEGKYVKTQNIELTKEKM